MLKIQKFEKSKILLLSKTNTSVNDSVYLIPQWKNTIGASPWSLVMKVDNTHLLLLCYFISVTVSEFALYVLVIFFFSER